MIFNMVGGGGGQKKLSYPVYGFQIAISDSNPATRVSYPETIFGQPNGAYDIETPASGTGNHCLNDWEDCNLISGIHRQSGNSTDGWTDIPNTQAWTAGSGSLDMMTYIPTWYMKMTNDGTNITVGFCKTNIDGTWMDRAGSVGTERIGHFRVGCFAAYNSSSKLYSRGSVSPTVETSITKFITYAKARGTGYDIMTWYQWTYLTALAVLLYKSTDLQTAMASGYVSGSSVQSETSLPFANEYGMYGVMGTTGTTQMSFFWIQNLWGNMYQFVGGAKTNSSCKLLCQTGYSSVTESDFDVATGQGPSSSGSGYITQVSGTTDSGFFPTAFSGSETTYFADNGSVDASSFPLVGGYYNRGDSAGPFYAFFYSSATRTYSNVGARLSYRL
jgi:hypothetical protein